MRWCYKTVHYELKKEGFLGSSFLDEAEVEQSLNDYGQSGWELVSVTETQDGLIAIFKQPLDTIQEQSTAREIFQEIDPPTYEQETPEIITENDVIDNDVEEEDSVDNDLHTIRIE